jgi:molecular chaperone DnaJ
LPPRVRNYYTDLGVEHTASISMIKSAWHKLALLHHPDKNPSGQKTDAVEFRTVSPLVL